jgi:hypothetical protein
LQFVAKSSVQCPHPDADLADDVRQGQFGELFRVDQVDGCSGGVAAKWRGAAGRTRR